MISPIVCTVREHVKTPVEGLAQTSLAIAIGLFLVASASLKLPVRLSDRAAIHPESVILLLEFFLGAGLLFFPRQRQLWAVATLLFAVFAVVSATKWARGESSCGCFGRVDVPPQYTLVVDLWILSLLIFARLRPRVFSDVGLAKYGFFAATVAPLSLLPLFAANAPVSAVMPSKRDPLSDVLKSLDNPAILRGRWLVLFYQRGCESCESLASAFSRRRVSEAWASVPCVMIEMHKPERPDSIQRETFAESSNENIVRCAHSIHAELPSPIVAEVIDGQVRSILRETDVVP